MDGLVFLIPDQRIDLPADDVRRLTGELELLERDAELDPDRPPQWHRYEAAGTRRRLEQTLESGAAAGPVELEQWAHGERQALVRALEHLRNASTRLSPPLVAPVVEPLHVLLDAILGVYQFGTLPYELEASVPGLKVGEPCFASYSGEYERGDRLVTADGQALRVVGRQDGSERERLLVELFNAS
jgi:hypothetical protein